MAPILRPPMLSHFACWIGPGTVRAVSKASITAEHTETVPKLVWVSPNVSDGQRLGQCAPCLKCCPADHAELLMDIIPNILTVHFRFFTERVQETGNCNFPQRGVWTVFPERIYIFWVESIKVSHANTYTHTHTHTHTHACTHPCCLPNDKPYQCKTIHGPWLVLWTVANPSQHALGDIQGQTARIRSKPQKSQVLMDLKQDFRMPVES